MQAGSVCVRMGSEVRVGVVVGVCESAVWEGVSVGDGELEGVQAVMNARSEVNKAVRTVA